MNFEQPISKEIFERKYMLNNEKDSDEVFHLIAKEISSVEKDHKYWENVFYDYLSSTKFMPGGRTLANARPNSKNKNYNNCFTIDVEDSMQDIFSSLKEDATISAAGGGVGFNISKLRPKGADIKSGGETSGPISFLKIFNESAKVIQTGGGRRAAHIAIMNIDHPDIEEFITIKHGDQNKELTQFNISVGITDKFINAVENDLDWNLQFNGKVYKTVKARYLYDLMATNAYEHNEPGILNLDIVERYNNGWWAFKVDRTNPCFPDTVKVIEKEKGEITIKDLEIGDFIFSEDGWVKVINKFSNGKKEVFRYYTKLNNKRYIDLTPNHKIKENGNKVEVQFAKGIDCFGIPESDKIFTFTDEIISKESIGEMEVWDITVDGENHTFLCNNYNISNCGEICMPSYSLCCLGSINLSKFVLNPFEENSEFDFESYAEAIKVGVRFLDNVLDVTNYPLKKIEDVSKQWRRIGLGFTALADMFTMLKIEYGSKESLDMCEELASIMRDVSYDYSTVLAIEKGKFPSFDIRIMESNFIKELPKDIQERILKFGLRNIALNTCAPNGTISLTIGQNCSSGIEPIFALKYDRNIRTGNGDETKKETVYDNAFLEYKKWSERTGKEWDEEEWNRVFKTTSQIDPYRSVDVQAVWQKYIDHSISKTANLPMNYPFEEYKNLFMYAYKKGLKGFTSFNPTGSMKGILEVDNTKKEEKVFSNNAPKRPIDLQAEVHSVKVKENNFLVIVGLYNDLPYELFVTDITQEEPFEMAIQYGKGIIRKQGKGNYNLVVQNGEEKIAIKNIGKVFNGDYESMSRLISTSLRHGVPLQFIVDQLTKEKSFASFGKAISRVLKHYIKEGEKVLSSDKCKECNSDLVYADGCKSCPSCGWSKCS